MHRFRLSHPMLRIRVLLPLLVLSLSFAAVPARAAAHRDAGGPVLPSGQASVAPHQVSTSTTPQVLAGGGGTVPYRPAPGGIATVPSPQNVVRVPAPVGVNLSTKLTFTGQPDTGWHPSDSNGAGGTSNYVETVNEQLVVYSRAGSQQFATNFNTWFGLSGSLFDPVTQWDYAGKRVLFIVDTGSSLLVSVARQTNALGNYCNYTFNTPSGYFADFEKLGVDADGVYFSVNLYGNNGQPFTNELFFANRAQMESCQTVNYTFWTGLTNPDGSIAFAIVPARQDTSSSGIEYLVNSYPGGACQLTLWQLTSGAVLTRNTVSTQCYSPPPPAKQAGSSGTIDAGDNRLYQANYVNGLLTLDTVGSHDWGDGNGPVGIVEWFVLNASSNSVFSQGSFGTQGYWLFYPATIRNYAGHMLFVYDASGPSIDPSIWYVNQTLAGTLALKSGVSFYGTSGTSRWGDYQSAWPDPTVSGTGVRSNAIWITGQYANGTGTWGTGVGLVTP